MKLWKKGKEVTDMHEFFKYCGYINVKNSFFCPNNILTNDRVSHVTQKDFINITNNKV